MKDVRQEKYQMLTAKVPTLLWVVHHIPKYLRIEDCQPANDGNGYHTEDWYALAHYLQSEVQNSLRQSQKTRKA